MCVRVCENVCVRVVLCCGVRSEFVSDLWRWQFENRVLTVPSLFGWQWFVPFLGFLPPKLCYQGTLSFVLADPLPRIHWLTDGRTETLILKILMGNDLSDKIRSKKERII